MVNSIYFSEKEAVPEGLFTTVSRVILNTLVIVTPRAFTRIYTIGSVPVTYHCATQITLKLNIIVTLLTVVKFFTPDQIEIKLSVTGTILNILIILIPAVLMNMYENSVVRYRVIAVPALVMLNILLTILTTITMCLSLGPTGHN